MKKYAKNAEKTLKDCLYKNKDIDNRIKEKQMNFSISYIKNLGNGKEDVIIHNNSPKLNRNIDLIFSSTYKKKG